MSSLWYVSCLKIPHNFPICSLLKPNLPFDHSDICYYLRISPQWWWKSWKSDISNNCVDWADTPITHSSLSCSATALGVLMPVKPKYRKRRKPPKYFSNTSMLSREGKCTRVCHRSAGEEALCFSAGFALMKCDLKGQSVPSELKLRHLEEVVRVFTYSKQRPPIVCICMRVCGCGCVWQ